MNKRLLLALGLMVVFAVMGFAADKKFTLVIDAGHGGHDAGALGTYSKEKNINLDVALAFGKNVERNCPDVKVVYTRRTDVFVTLLERANIANRNKADLFISIHTNALPGGKRASGLETYTLGMHRASDNFDVAKRENSVILYEKDYKQHYEGFDPNSSESYIMFEFLQDKNMAKSVDIAKFVQRRACVATGRANKGVKQAGFLVLRETSMPSCLIELGFITTPSDERYLNSKEGVEALGKGIYQAFLDYRKKYDKGFTVPYEAVEKGNINIPAIVPDDTGNKKSVRQTVKKSKPEISEGERIRRELLEAREGKSVSSVDSGSVECAEDTDGLAPKAGKKHAAVELREKQSGEAKALERQNGAEPAVSSNTNGEVRTVSDEMVSGGRLLFKVQILTSSYPLKTGSPQFKGTEGVDCYSDKGLFKYTCGASENYNEIYRLRKALLAKFPEAFIIAFKDGKRTDVVEALKEYKRKRGLR
ncbi:N-acetylmuramoyl-L-alanine amidase [Xylanibacter muris]|uniref:N-acetylmuramoyl-L-alanine amidase n=2 Tax=Xylanibacter muris TaxID=2736290 RepID=A0ABX2APQ6_9BACT|nr:N-acetylmuramoyl-L-alanine amidase [Xylanibacter muris]